MISNKKLKKIIWENILKKQNGYTMYAFIRLKRDYRRLFYCFHYANIAMQ